MLLPLRQGFIIRTKDQRQYMIEYKENHVCYFHKNECFYND